MTLRAIVYCGSSLLPKCLPAKRLLDVAEQRLPHDDIVLRVWDERVPRIVRDWTGRRTAWNQLFDIQWTYNRWNELEGFITARNIVAHGMGVLTRSQLSRGQIKPGTIQSLARASLTLNGHELVLREGDIERCNRRVRHFISWLDGVSRTIPV
jgi:hypothetical protein